MMSGSSHAADRQLLDMVRDKSLSGGELVTASVLVEPTHREFHSRRSSATAHSDEEAITPVAGIMSGTPPPNRRQDGGGDSEDRTDLAPRTTSNAPVKPEPIVEEEEGCGVKCLYYTMQCCECTLM